MFFKDMVKTPSYNLGILSASYFYYLIIWRHNTTLRTVLLLCQYNIKGKLNIKDLIA